MAEVEAEAVPTPTPTPTRPLHSTVVVVPTLSLAHTPALAEVHEILRRRATITTTYLGYTR